VRVLVSHVIDVPADIVWADVSNMKSHAEWMADAEGIDVVSTMQRGVGTVLKVPTRIGPFRTVDWIIVTDWIEGRSIRVVHVGLVSGEGEFRIEPNGDATLFLWDEDLTLPLLFGGRIGEVIARPIIAGIWRGNLRRLAERFSRD
jgi:hypothetical protein